METPPSNQTSCSTDERPGRRSPRLSTGSMGTAAEEVFDDEDLICVMRAKLSADELTGTWAFTDGGAEAGTLRYKNVQDGDERGVRVMLLSLKAGREEGFLRDKHGERYRAYAADVPQFFPTLPAIKSFVLGSD